MRMDNTRRMLATMALAVLTVIALAQPALASDQTWRATDYSGLTVATASFDDAANRVYITDTKADGSRSNGVAAKIDIWRVGNRGGTHVPCTVGSRGSTNCPLIWVEDTHLEGQLCQYSSNASEFCSPIKDFYS